MKKIIIFVTIMILLLCGNTSYANIKNINPSKQIYNERCLKNWIYDGFKSALKIRVVATVIGVGGIFTVMIITNKRYK